MYIHPSNSIFSPVLYSNCTMFIHDSSIKFNLFVRIFLLSHNHSLKKHRRHAVRCRTRVLGA